MPKRARDDLETFFERLLAIANTLEPADDTLNFLKKLTHLLLQADAEKVMRKAATDFTLKEAVQDFDLTYKRDESWWKIEDMPAVQRFQPSACLGKAKFTGTLFSALSQLVVYLACLRQSRINRRRSNTSVFGVATDGLSYIFVTITHEGVLKKSNPFDVLQGGLEIVLGSFQYILETAMSMKEETQSDESDSDADTDDDYDDVVDLDDNPFLYPDDEEYTVH
ncbi:hypothetical protein JOM56_011503 [Amanita muscaria]